MELKQVITKNTYYSSPLWFIIGIESSIRKNSKYALSKSDLKNGYYIPIKFNGMELKIPFKALFHTNSKIKGIKGLDFNNATYCQGYIKNKCQICNKNLCYANVFEKQYIKNIRVNKGSNKGHLMFNAYYKGFLLVECFKVLYSDKSLYNKFLEYIDNNIKVLRFNVNSDFNSLKDYKLILDIANKCLSTTIYGYTTRDDLILTNEYKKYYNLYINGSNKVYTNRYKVTFSLETYFKALNKCLGGCNGCKKCFKLNNAIITTLFHHNNSDSILNTYNNRLFIVKLVNALDSDLKLTETDLKAYKGIFKSLNAFLINKYGLDMELMDITNIKGFLDYIWYMPKIELIDNLNNLNNANKSILMEYGLI